MLGLASRQFKATVSGAGVTKGGNTRERAAEKEKEKVPAKDGPSSPKREAEEEERKTTDGCGAGLVSDLLLQSSSARPSRPYHARRSNSANGRYIGRSGICQRYPAHLHESRTW